QDLFKTGLARETDDPALAAEAARTPGRVLVRPADGRGRLSAMPPARARKPVGPSRVQRRRVAEAAAALEALDEAFERDRAARACAAPGRAPRPAGAGCRTRGSSSCRRRGSAPAGRTPSAPLAAAPSAPAAFRAARAR